MLLLNISAAFSPLLALCTKPPITPAIPAIAIPAVAKLAVVVNALAPRPEKAEEIDDPKPTIL